MSENDAEIEKASGRVTLAEMLWRGLAMQNVYGLTPAHRAELNIRYDAAGDELMNAKEALRELVRARMQEMAK